MAQKSSKIIIEHVRDDGGFSATSLRAVDVCLDEGFVQKGIVVPTVKIICYNADGFYPYYLLYAYQTHNIVSNLKRNIGEKDKIHLPYTIFDPGILSDLEAKLALLSAQLPTTLLKTIINGVEKTEFLRPLGMWNSRFDFNKLPKGAAHIFARSLPTPQRPPEVSKYQYFKFLLSR